MPIDRVVISRSQFCGLLELDEQRFRSVSSVTWTAREGGEQRCTGDITIYLEPEAKTDERDAAKHS